MKELIRFIDDKIKKTDSVDYINHLNKITKDSDLTYIIIKTELTVLMEIKMQILTKSI
jgi:hypothetical protein